MLIRESDLRRIIRQELMREAEAVPWGDTSTGVDPDIEDEPQSPAIVRPRKTGIAASIELAGAASQLNKYSRMKVDANIPGMDNYFHFLAFCAAGEAMKDAGVVDAFGRLTALGQAKEDFDLKLPLGATSAISQTRKGSPLDRIATLLGVGRFQGDPDKAPYKSAAAYEEALAEWKGDDEINRAGIRSGLRGDNCCSAALKYIQLSKMPTVGELRAKSEVWSAFLNRSYGWIFKQKPELYGDDMPFIQPRYHCGLTPEQRAFAYKRRVDLARNAPSGSKLASDLSGAKPPISGIKGPLRIG